MDINRVFISGTLTRDPELLFTVSNHPFARMNIIVRQQSRVNFFDVIVYGKLAEICSEKLKKDSKIIIEGKLKFSRFTINTGEKRNKVEIDGETIHFVEKGGKVDGSE